MSAPRLSYANVVASLALFVSLGGGAYAMSRLPADSVGTRQLRNRSVTAKKVARNALTGAQIRESTLGVVPRAGRSDFAASASFANDAGNAASATKALSADTAATATKAASATTALTAATAARATSATTASTATSATTAGTATSATHATSATTAANAIELGGRPATGYLTSGRLLSASLDPVTGTGKHLFTDTATGAAVLDGGKGAVEITNTNASGYLTVEGISTSPPSTTNSGVTARSATIAPGASAQITGTAPVPFLDVMIIHLGTSPSASTRMRLTCSLGTDPTSSVSSLSCIGLH